MLVGDRAAGKSERRRCVLAIVAEQQPLQEAELSLLPRIRLEALGLVDRSARERYEACECGSLCGELEPVPPEGRVAGQLRRSPKGCSGRTVAPAALGLLADLFQRGGGCLVDADGGRCQVPSAGVARKHVGQLSVHGPLRGGGSRVVDGRARERMAEDDPVLDDAQEAAVLRRRETVGRQSIRDRRQRVRHARARDEQCLTSLAGEGLEPSRERPLERGPDAGRIRERSHSGQLLGRQHGDDLLERKRISSGQRHELVSDLRADLAHAGEQFESILLGQTRNLEHLDTAEFELAGSRRGEDPDRPAVQPPDHEPERVRRGAVEPLRVVHDDEHGTRSCGRLQKRHRRQRENETVSGDSILEGERRPQGVSLRRGDLVEVVEQRQAELGKAREGQLELGLDAGRAQNPHVGGLRSRPSQQRGLADPGLTLQREYRASPGTDVVEPRGKASLLSVPAEELQGTTLVKPDAVFNRERVDKRST